MTITTLSPYKGTTWQIAFDNSLALFFLDAEIINEYQLDLGDILTEEQWTTIQNAQQTRKAYRWGTHLVDAHPYTYKGMYAKIATKYPEDVALDATSRLAENGYINDVAYAEEAANHYIVTKHYGPRRAREQMHRRGLLDEQIENALEGYDDYIMENLQTLIAGKFGRYFIDPNDRLSLEKGKAALARYGYAYDDINDAIRTYFEKEELENAD